MNLKNTLILPVIAAAFSTSAFAVTFSDDFNRADSSTVGNGWIDPVAAPDFSIVSNAVSAGAGAGDQVLYNAAAQTLNTVATDSFSISADVSFSFLAGSAFGGIAFNIQDEDNYYALRMNGTGTVQVIRKIGGSTSGTVISQTNQFIPVVDRAYRMNVFSENAYEFDLSITDTVTSTVVYSFNDRVDTGSNFADGLGGLFRGTNVVSFDNFSIETTSIPEPGTTAAVIGALAFGVLWIKRRK